jgi:cyanate lyase
MTESIRDRLRREIMAEWKDAMRRAILKHWIRDNSRDLAWAAQQIGYTETYITAVLEGRRPMSEALTKACATKLGIDFGYVGVGKDPRPQSTTLGVA